MSFFLFSVLWPCPENPKFKAKNISFVWLLGWSETKGRGYNKHLRCTLCVRICVLLLTDTMAKCTAVQRKMPCVFVTSVQDMPSSKRANQQFMVTASDTLNPEVNPLDIDSALTTEKVDGTCCLVQEYQGSVYVCVFVCVCMCVFLCMYVVAGLCVCTWIRV